MCAYRVPFRSVETTFGANQKGAWAIAVAGKRIGRRVPAILVSEEQATVSGPIV